MLCALYGRDASTHQRVESAWEPWPSQLQLQPYSEASQRTHACRRHKARLERGAYAHNNMFPEPQSDPTRPDAIPSHRAGRALHPLLPAAPPFVVFLPERPPLERRVLARHLAPPGKRENNRRQVVLPACSPQRTAAHRGAARKENATRWDVRSVSRGIKERKLGKAHGNQQAVPASDAPTGRNT